MKKELIGNVAVDSGQLIITDPCYLNHWKADEFESQDTDVAEYDYSYTGACNATLSEHGCGQLNHESAVAFTSGWGDGIYPVYAVRNGDGRIVKVIIEME